MQLYLDSFGAYLSVKNGCFSVRMRNGAVQAFAPRRVDAIMLTRGTACSTDVLLLAVEHDIPVLLIDADTHFPRAQVWSGQYGSIATIRKNQAAFVRTPAAFAWVTSLLAQKIERQREHLYDLCRHPGSPPAMETDLRLADRVLADLEQRLRRWQAPAPWDPDTTAGAIRGQEGTASRLYFQQLTKFLAGKTPFEGRGKRPAADPFNALLNYLYGMLYTQVQLALLKSGLDPALGILHADQHRRPTLVFDCIEPFRPWADAVAVQLVVGERLPPDAFEDHEHTEGYRLAGPGKDVVIEAMLDFLETASGYEGRQVKRRIQIDLEIRKLAVQLKDAP